MPEDDYTPEQLQEMFDAPDVSTLTAAEWRALLLSCDAEILDGREAKAP